MFSGEFSSMLKTDLPQTSSTPQLGTLNELIHFDQAAEHLRTVLAKIEDRGSEVINYAEKETISTLAAWLDGSIW